MATLAVRPMAVMPGPGIVRRDHWVVLSLACLALAAGAVSALGSLVRGLDLDQPLPGYVAAVNAGDRTAARVQLAGDGAGWGDFTDWLITTDAVVRMSGCASSADGLVTCQVAYGEDWFFNRTAPPEVSRHGALLSEVTMRLSSGQVQIIDWPLPPGLSEVEAAFRSWVLRYHPEVAGRLWDSPTVGNEIKGHMLLDATGGEGHARLLEPYLHYLHPPTE